MSPTPPEHHLSRRDEARLLRRLTAAVSGERAGAGAGLALGALLGGVMALVAMAIYLGGGPPQRVYGVIVGFGVTESLTGTFPLVRVAVDDREALVPISRSQPCQLGDRIGLDRRKGLLGYKYDAGLRGCIR